MKKIRIITLMFFAGFALNAQTASSQGEITVETVDTNNIDTYKVIFDSPDASGSFKEMSGKVSAYEKSKEAADSTIGLTFDLKINVASISMENGTQTKHAKSKEWFNAVKYPSINFVSSNVFRTNKGVFAQGKLTLHGVTRDVTIPIEIKSLDTKIIYKAQFSVKRMDYRLGPDSKVSRMIKIIAGVSVKK